MLSRCARERRVYFVEEPRWVDGPSHLDVMLTTEGVTVVVPQLEQGSDRAEEVQAELLQRLIAREGLRDYVLWYYTPMALPIAAGLSPRAVVYDCMDQLAAFKDAPPELTNREMQLFQRADVVFTGGQALFEAKKNWHHNIYAFPSSVDVPHFAKARATQTDPSDQEPIPRPRLGFFGVIDERMDLELVAGVAAARPDWNLVLLGPVVKIDEQGLPRAPNIFYLGGKSYQELPHYVSGWDVALLPFLRNESTEFISPTKTPEYLAAGLPVVSTSIRDVVRPYESLGLVRIADSVDRFVSACEAALAEAPGPRLAQADEFLSRLSWDSTWRSMSIHVDQIVNRRALAHPGRLVTSKADQDSETPTIAAGE
ncbi:MAG TPA: glycosyltransferase [Polyangiaceae bacterium]|nr:glycosyltransferase [Polyangiaceae bacterium]